MGRGFLFVGMFTVMQVFSVQAALSVNDSLPQIRTCHTQEQHHTLKQRYNYTSIQEQENKVRKLITAYRAGRRQEALLRIPVVVHVVHAGTDAGEGANITAEQVYSQLDVLNEDFRRKKGTPGFSRLPKAADVKIEFVPASLSPEGKILPEPGIHRYSSATVKWPRDSIEKVLKPATQWNPNHYMNIWTVAFKNPTMLGYAQLPSLAPINDLPAHGGPKQTDGVVIGYRFFGRKGNLQPPFHRGRTTTHEVGHWLGLRHIWGDGNCSSDDYCADTPVSSRPHYGCPEQEDSCPENAGYDMYRNYMDYTNDACMNLFTHDQKARMRMVLTQSPGRYSLLSSPALPAIQAPIAQLPGLNSTYCLTQSLVLRTGAKAAEINWSLMNNNEVMWSSKQQTCTVSFASPGNYKLRLILTNNQGADTAYHIFRVLQPQKPDIQVQQNRWLSADKPASTYQWYHNGATIPGTAGGNERAIYAARPGNYQLATTDTSGCKSWSGEKEIKQEKFLPAAKLVYPNPVRQMLTIIPANTTLIRLRSLKGKPLRQWGAESQLNLSFLKQGVYLLELQIDSQWYRQRIVRQ